MRSITITNNNVGIGTTSATKHSSKPSLSTRPPVKKLASSPSSPTRNGHINLNSATSSSSQSTASTSTTSSLLSDSTSSSLSQAHYQLTIGKLTQEIQELREKEELAQTHLRKSDAIIVELRSTVLSLQQQIDQNNTNNSTKQLQTELEQAQEQILTGEMVRQELEDTIEAEQYTWELRVEDQERRIKELQDECDLVKDELSKAREERQSQREGISSASDTARNLLKTEERKDNENVVDQLRRVEKERQELQSCLEEAMEELQAVDEELRQQHPEPLKELYKWTWRRFESKNDKEKKCQYPETVNEMVSRIQQMVDSSDVALLENKLMSYRGELKAKEEASAELRESLNEAMNLLKPLQDSIAQADLDKASLQQQVDRVREEKKEITAIKDTQLKALQMRIQILQQRQDSKNSAAPSLPLPKNEESANRKRRSEEKFQKLFGEAQSRFQAIKSQNADVVAENVNLKKRLFQTEADKSIEQLEQELKEKTEQLEVEKEQTQKLQMELKRSRNLEQGTDKTQAVNLERGMEETNERSILEAEIEKAKQELKKKDESENLLRASLEEAMGLLKPLEKHLKKAEQEKKALRKKVKALYAREAMSNRGKNPEDDTSSADDSQREGGGNSAMTEEIQNLKQQLKQSEDELENAKHIATSALMKVEELTVASIQVDSSARHAQTTSKTEVEQLRSQVVDLQTEVMAYRERNGSLSETLQGKNRRLNPTASGSKQGKRLEA